MSERPTCPIGDPSETSKPDRGPTGLIGDRLPDRTPIRADMHVQVRD